MSPVRCRLVGRSITALVAVVLAAACADGASKTEGAARVAGTEEFSASSAAAPTTPRTTTASYRVVWPFETKVPPEILDLLQPDEWLHGYAMVPGSGLIMGTAVGRGGTDYRCRTSLWQIDPLTGARTKIASGILPTLSPDGTKLAYAQQRSPNAREPAECGLDDIAVRTVATGLTMTADIPRSDDTRLAAFALRWSPDSTRVRFYIGYENSDAVSGPLVFDLDKNSTIAIALGPSVRDELSATFAPHIASHEWEVVSGVWLHDGSLAVTVSCGMGCLSELPREAQPAWYRIDADYVLGSLNDPVTEPAFLAQLERCIGITYC